MRSSRPKGNRGYPPLLTIYHHTTYDNKPFSLQFIDFNSHYFFGINRAMIQRIENNLYMKSAKSLFIKLTINFESYAIINL